jgi:phage tail sheath gpL-like
MSGVPNNIIIPFVGVEFDASRASAGPAEYPVNLLAIGQRLSSGTVAAETKFSSSDPDDVAMKAGFGSQIHMMAKKIFQNSGTVPVTFISLDDAATAAAATTVFTISGTATKLGEIDLYIGGVRIAVSVAVGDAAAAVAASLKAAIDDVVDELPITAGVAGAVMTLTAKNKGIAAGDLDVRLNYNKGESLPEGITFSSIVHTDGTVDPDIGDALAVIGGDWFNVIAHPYSDNANMSTLEDELDTLAGVMEQRDALAYTAVRDTDANMITYGTDTNRNSQWCAVLSAYKRMESTAELAAGYAAMIAAAVINDPAKPFHRVTLKGFDALDSNDKSTNTERNLLAKASVATLTDDLGVQSEATVTMYRKNSAGAADTAYQQQNAVFTLSKLRYTFVNHLLKKFPRAKLAKSSDGVAAGQQIITPKIGKAEAVAWYLQMARLGLVEGGAAVDQFKKEIRVEIDDTNVNRLNFLLPPDLMNQFIVGSGVMQFLS